MEDLALLECLFPEKQDMKNVEIENKSKVGAAFFRYRCK
jgi:hypothetical protein